MDADLASSINRRDARLIAEFLDDRWAAREQFGFHAHDWAEASWADLVVDDKPEDASARAWWVGGWAAQIPGLYFDGAPADCDWENLYSHLRAEILARRAPQTPHAQVAENAPCGVV